MEGVAAAASFATLIEVSTKILQYSAAVRGAKDEIRRFHQSLQALRDALERAKQLLDRPDAATSLPASREVFDALEACQPQLEELLEKLQKKLPKPDSRTGRIAGSIGISSLRWPFQSKDIDSHVQRFESWKTTINLALQTDQTSVVLDISQKIDLSKLPSADAAIFDSHVDEHEARCLPGTRTDLLQGVSDWAASSESKLIFWLHGMAGTGKSTISRTVAQDFADKGMLAASFFFKRGEAPRGDATRFFTTIAVQLASNFPAVIPHIKGVLDSDPDISKRTMAQQFEKLILHPLAETKAVLPTSIGVIVVDALDECEREQDIRMILRLLTRVQELQHLTLRFFITSRPERSPRLGFKAMSGGAHEDLILEEVAPLTIEHDISIFFEHEFAKIREEYNVSQDPPLPEDWPGPQNVQTLVKTAVPLFISAATTCLFIRDPRFDPSDRLQKVLTHQTSSHSSKFDKTYLPVLDQLLSGLTGSEKESILTEFKQVVGSIIIFAQPLSKTSIAKLLGITENTVHRVLDWLHSVLSIPNNRDFPVRLLHLSFRDFLVDPDKRGTNPFWIDEKQQHRMIASKCLDLLSRPECLTTNICDVRSPGMSRTEVDTQTIATCLASHVQYACCYWVHHLEAGGEHVRDGDQVHQFLKIHFLQWIEALSLLAKTSEGVTMILALQDLLEHNASSDIAAFLGDARRFILRNRTIIDDTPLQIYSSALIFAPGDSIVKKLFRDQIPPWIRRHPETLPHWGPALQTLEHNIVNVALQFSEDSKLLASVNSVGAVKLWDPVTGGLLQSLETNSSRCLCISRDHNFMATEHKGSISVWDIAAGERLRTLPSHTVALYGAAFSPDGNTLAVRWEGALGLWDVHTGDELRTLSIESTTALTSPCTDSSMTYDASAVHFGMPCPSVVSFSSDGNLLAAQVAGRVKVWNLSAGETGRTLDGNARCMGQFVFSPDSKFLAVVCEKVIEIWNPSMGALLHSLEISSQGGNKLEFSVDSRLLASTDGLSTVNVWDVARGKLLRSWDYDNIGPRGTFAWSKHSLLALTFRHTIKIVDCASGGVLSELEGHASSVVRIAFSGDGKLLASASLDRTARTWDVTSGFRHDDKKAGATENHIISRAALSRDGKFSSAAPQRASHATVTIRDLTLNGQTETTLNIQDSSSITAMAFSGDNKSLGMGCYTGAIWLWDSVSDEIHSLGNMMQTNQEPPEEAQQGKKHIGEIRHDRTLVDSRQLTKQRAVNLLVFSNNGQVLAAASSLTVVLWDLASRICRDILDLREGSVCVLTFSKDDRYLAVASQLDIYLFDMTTGTGCHINTDREYVGGGLVFSADSRYLLSVNAAKARLSLWDISTQQRVQLIQGMNNNFGGPLVALSGEVSCIETPFGILRVPLHPAPTPKLQCPLKLFYLDGWIIRDGEKLLRIPQEYRIWSDSDTGSSFGGNTFSWINRHRRLTVLEIECE